MYYEVLWSRRKHWWHRNSISIEHSPPNPTQPRLNAKACNLISGAALLFTPDKTTVANLRGYSIQLTGAILPTIFETPIRDSYKVTHPWLSTWEYYSQTNEHPSTTRARYSNFIQSWIHTFRYIAFENFKNSNSRDLFQIHLGSHQLKGLQYPLEFHRKYSDVSTADFFAHVPQKFFRTLIEVYCFMKLCLG